MSTIPTGYRAIGPPNPYKYWWLRSLCTDYYYNACHVDQDGYIGTYDGYHDYVDVSYGHKNRRARMVLTTLGLFTLLAASASALSPLSATFPTE